MSQNGLGLGLGFSQLKIKIKKEIQLLRFELTTRERRAWTRDRHVADAWVANRFADRVACQISGHAENERKNRGMPGV